MNGYVFSLAWLGCREWYAARLCPCKQEDHATCRKDRRRHRRQDAKKQQHTKTDIYKQHGSGSGPGPGPGLGFRARASTGTSRALGCVACSDVFDSAPCLLVHLVGRPNWAFWRQRFKNLWGSALLVSLSLPLQTTSHAKYRAKNVGEVWSKLPDICQNVRYLPRQCFF